jgi:hydroxypyruvate isomerase
MDRRKFIQKGALTGSFLGLGGLGIERAFAKAITAQNVENTSNKQLFNLQYAPHIGMFRHHAGDDPVAQLEFMAAQGFTAFEDNEMKGRPIAQQNAMAAAMAEHSMEMGVFVAHKIYWTEPNLASGKQNLREEFLADIKSSIAVAKRIGAKWMTVVHGHVDSPQAYQICKAVNSPSCKILFDIYHQQIQEGNLIPNIEQCWDEIAYFQIGDNPGRNEPTSGEINYKNVFKYIHGRGFKGVLGMEHGNSIKGKEGEQRVIDAYVESDGFL